MEQRKSPNEMIEQALLQARSFLRAPSVPTEVEEKLRGVLQSAFSRMDVVSREEFDTQSAILARSRSKIEALEKELETIREQISELEKT